MKMDGNSFLPRICVGQDLIVVRKEGADAEVEVVFGAAFEADVVVVDAVQGGVEVGGFGVEVEAWREPRFSTGK
jgi:hypothetical protein